LFVVRRGNNRHAPDGAAFRCVELEQRLIEELMDIEKQDAPITNYNQETSMAL
jgi:hypothetical protein